MQGALNRTTKVRYMVENASSGALTYLLLPFYVLVFSEPTTEIWTLSAAVTLFTFLRFGWREINKNYEDSSYLVGLYTVTALLCLSSSMLAFRSLGAHFKIDQVLFNTIFVATMSSGVMAAFGAEPRIAALLGALILFPFSLALAQRTADLMWWIPLGSILYWAWNMLSVKRSYKNYFRLQNAEQLVQFQEIRLREFIDSLPGYVSWFDNELNYIDANNKLTEITGVEREEIVGKNLGFTNPTDPLVHKIRQFKNSNQPTEIIEISIQKEGLPDKHLLTMLLRYRLNSNEEQISVLSLDVTQLKMQEQELEKKRIQLINQEKYTALGEMAGGIAHEINNPLAIICGKTEVLLLQKEKGILTDEALERQLKGIHNTSQRLIKIVKSLKTLVRDGRIDSIEQTTVAAAIDPLLEILVSRLENMNVNLYVDRGDFEMEIRCGIVELGQVLMNLIVNAAQAIEPMDEKWVKISIRSDATKVYIIIVDSGNGISPEVQRKLFQPFFTTKAPGVGTGIGLSLSKELMQKQQGDLYYQSGLANTTFVLELPKGIAHKQAA